MSMVSYASTAKKLTDQKNEASKNRRKNERELKKAKSLSRKYSSNLKTIHRRVESSREQAEDVGGVLNQRQAQLESIQRLKQNAEERLVKERESLEESENEMEFSQTADEKQNISYKIKMTSGNIEDLKNQIKQRNSMEKKIIQDIEEYEKSKSKINSSIKKNLQAKPGLVKLAKSTVKKVDTTQKRFGTSKRREESTKKQLVSVTKKLNELEKQRRVRKAKEAALKRAKARKAKEAALKRAKAKRSRMLAARKAKKAKAKPKAKKAKAKPKAKKAKAKKHR